MRVVHDCCRCCKRRTAAALFSFTSGFKSAEQVWCYKIKLGGFFILSMFRSHRHIEMIQCFSFIYDRRWLFLLILNRLNPPVLCLWWCLSAFRFSRIALSQLTFRVWGIHFSEQYQSNASIMHLNDSSKICHFSWILEWQKLNLLS